MTEHDEEPKAENDGTRAARLTNFRGVQVRTQDGRKIDRWTCAGFDGETVEIDVMIITEGGAPMFIARSSHPSFRKMAWRATDISQLEKIVAAGVEAEFAKLSRGAWRPGLLIEASTHHSKPDRLSSSNMISIKLGVTSIMTPRTRQQRNDGLVEIIKEGRRLPILEHGAEPVTPDLENSLWDRKNTVSSMIEHARMRYDAGTTAAAVDADDQTDARVRVLFETIKGFGESMALSLGPDRIRLDGLPDGQALAAMLLQAAADAEARVADADAKKADDATSAASTGADSAEGDSTGGDAAKPAED